MNISGEGYSLTVDDNSNTVAIKGSLRLNGMDEYTPVLDALRNTMNSDKPACIDLTGLEFLNSSGIAILSKFVIEARGKEGLVLTINGSEQIPWQGKSLKNLQRLWPALNLNII